MIELRKAFYLTFFQIRARYRKTFAGFFWVIANPVVTFYVQALIFKHILKIELPSYSLFLLSGLLPWFFITQSLNMTASSLVNSRELLLSLKIHPLTIVGSQVLDQFINFIAAFFILLIFQIGSLNLFSFVPILILVNLAVLMTFTFVVCLFISFWHVFYRDIQFVVQFVMGIIYFVTPIFYPRHLIPEAFQWIIDLNPFYPFIQLFQSTLFQLDLTLWSLSLLKCMTVILSLGALTQLSFKIKMRDFYINV